MARSVPGLDALPGDEARERRPVDPQQSFTLEFVASMINFGALIAFTVVNLTVIVFYAWRLKQRRTPKEIFRNIVLPFIGMCLTGMLWINLHFEALRNGAIWLAIGIILLLYMTRGFREPLTMKIEEETLAEETAGSGAGRAASHARNRRWLSGGGDPARWASVGSHPGRDDRG